jgi:serine/threonine-protein kinase
MSADLRQLALVGPRDAFGAAAVKERPAVTQPGDSTVTASFDDDAAPARRGWGSPIVRYGMPAALLVSVAAWAMYVAQAPSPMPSAAVRPLDPQREIPSLPLAVPATSESEADTNGAGAPAAVVATAAPPAASAAKPVALARVGFAVTPWGEVYIDGRKTGITPPLNEMRLPPGRHTIEIRNTTFPPHRRTVDLRADASVRIKHKFE